MSDDSTVCRFTMDGPGGRQRFDFDADPALLLGDQTQIVRERTGLSALQWIRKVAAISAETADDQDFLVMAYLARYRENPLLNWGHFVSTVAPITVQLAADDEPAAEPAADPTPPAAPKPRASRSRKPPSS